MNLPTQTNQFQIVSRKSPEERKNFRASWGAKTEGIKEGDFVQGVILGFETSEFGAKNIVLKSFTHGNQQLLIFGCSSLQRELHIDDTCTELLFFPGDVVQVTYRGSYIGKKGKSMGKLVAIFAVDELQGYKLISQDIKDVKEFVDSQIRSQPVLNMYRPSQPPQQQFVSPQITQNSQPKTSFKRTTEEQSFDV